MVLVSTARRGYKGTMAKGNTLEIGDVIPRIRKESAMTIDDLAAATGLSRAYISQVETSKATPSLQTIRRICSALDVSPALLFEDPDAGCVLLRSDRQKVMHFETVIDGEKFHKIINVLSEQNKKIEMVLIELSPGNIAGDHAHAGEEIFYVLEGARDADASDARRRFGTYRQSADAPIAQSRQRSGQSHQRADAAGIHRPSA